MQRFDLRQAAAIAAGMCLALFVLAHGVASADDAKCVNTANKNTAKVAKAMSKDIAKCIKDGGAGKLPPGQTIEQCITSDPKGKVQKAKDKAKAKIQADCPSPPAVPPIDTTDPNALSEIMIDKELAVIRAIFGTDLDAVVAMKDPDKDEWKCQSAIAKAAGKCQDAKLATYNSCKKAELKAGVASAQALQDACMGANGTGDSIPDTKGKIDKKCGNGLGGTLGKKCGTTDNQALFPSWDPNSGTLGESIDQKIECAVCKALNALDGLNRNCDEFDDGVVNGSCGCGDGAVVIDTALGTLRGSMQGDVQAFLGIPFAEAPVGSLRFKPPVAASAWTGTRGACAFGPACPQPIYEGQTLYLNQSEDCLNLNVWTPAADGGLRPVMVWIHGGGWLLEGTEDPLYSGAKLAARGDVVVVSIEYRLGAFGFSHLSDLAGTDYAGSGNAAMLDQVLALEWVRDHIASFGGDAENVTIFGESAGGGAVHALLAMPAAAGLFHKAIVQSGPGTQPRTAAYANAISERLLAAAGVADVAGLVALSTEQILDAQWIVSEAVFVEDYMFGTVVDGEVLPEPPNHAVANGSVDDVPLMVGTVRDETRLYITFLPFLADDLPLSMFAVGIPYIERALPAGSTFADADALYTAQRPGASVNQISHAQATDVFFRLPMIRLAETHSTRAPGSTYVYRFDWPPPAPGWPEYDLGVPHGAELGFMLGNPEGWPAIYGDSIPQGLIDQMMDAWITFARTGNPNHPGMPVWEPYDLAEHKTMIFDTTDTAPTSQLMQDVDGVERAFWDGVPFDTVVPAMAPEDLF